MTAEINGTAGSPKPRPAAPQVDVRRRDIRSVLEIEGGKPDRHYRFIRNDPLAITKARLKGYTQVDINDKEEAKPIVPPDSGEGNAIVMGDVVLMSCPKEMFDQGREEIDRQRDELFKATDEKVETEARRVGVKTIRDKE